MRHEPPFDHDDLRKALEREYGIAARSFTFVPAASDAAAYVVEAAVATRYFLKVWPKLQHGSPDALVQHGTLAITEALAQAAESFRVPTPIRTTSADLWGSLAGMPLALALFLPGDHPSHAWSKDIARSVGRTFAELHRVTANLVGLAPRREALEVPFEPELRRNLEAALRLDLDAHPELRPLPDWVRANRDEVFAQLGRLHVFADATKRLESPFVLCHTDLHSNNVLVVGDNTLGVVDWDDVKLAPPEHDLATGVGSPLRHKTFGVFIDAYRDAGGVGRLHLEQFAFYLQRRYLDDTGYCLAHLLAPDADNRDAPYWLDGLRALAAGRRDRLDETLAVVAAAL